ncbi:type VII secretion protein EccB [Pseudactinotalea sp. HY158]|uniref:type VII secretion protein EccB n=1 Tax=Pseudactinotalea sp. HY158 TaxID=2654547 RepID=UPI00129C406C|nr:type VII secretion protein EccB [Pseudactinotalea sp. HY158]QGH70457.1 type VII secretion protein EccB [Pseudactinotalea sp. HY158]
MASKKELIAAQGFSRRRLVTAFTSGAPGGRELEPSSPLAGIIVGVVISVLIVVGSLAVGLFGGRAPQGWDERGLVIVADNGARYVALNGTLHPVANLASARLLAGEDDGTLAIATLKESQLGDTPRGNVTVGIPGAPDALTPADSLTQSGWTACIASGGGVAVSVPAAEDATRATTVPDPRGALVKAEGGGDLFYIWGPYRFPIAAVDAGRVDLALSTDRNQAVEVPGTWLNLFVEGPAITPLTMPGSGQPLSPAATAATGMGDALTVGSVVVLTDAQGNADGTYAFTADSELAPLTDLALNLYDRPERVPLTFSEAESLRRLPSAEIVPREWPTAQPEPLTGAPCAQLQHADDQGRASTELVAATEAPEAAGITVAPGAGALVALGSAQGGWGLVDESGTLYPIPAGKPTALTLLGYPDVDPPRIAAPWAALFRDGPQLSADAALAGAGT